MYKLTLRHYFDAAHQLPDSKDLISKACCNLHGHTYAVAINIKDEKLRSDMVVDFKRLKEIVDILDHKYLNDVFKDYNFKKPTTAENIAEFLYYLIQKEFNFSKLVIWVCEGYKGENKAGWVSYEE